MDRTRFTIFATAALTIDAAAAALHNILDKNNAQQQAAQCLQNIRSIPRLQKQIANLCTRQEQQHYVQKKCIAMEYTVQQLVLYTTAVKNGEPEPFDIWTAIVFLHYIDDRLKEIRTYFEIQ